MIKLVMLLGSLIDIAVDTDLGYTDRGDPNRGEEPVSLFPGGQIPPEPTLTEEHQVAMAKELRKAKREAKRAAKDAQPAE